MSIAPSKFELPDSVVAMTDDTKRLAVSTVHEDELLDASYQAAYKVAYKLLGHKQASEDAALEAVSRLIEKKLHVEEFAPSYAARVSARIVISSWRKDALARKYATRISSGETGIDRSSEISNLRLDLRKALQKLSQRQREIIVLRFLADLPERAVADFLNINIGTVKSTTHDALARLKSMVEVSL